MSKVNDADFAPQSVEKMLPVYKIRRRWRLSWRWPFLYRETQLTLTAASVTLSPQSLTDEQRASLKNNFAEYWTEPTGDWRIVSAGDP